MQISKPFQDLVKGMIPTIISAQVLSQNTHPNSRERGERYFQTGRVQKLYQRDRSVFARVVGSDSSPYQVQLQWEEESQVWEADCTCPYDFEGWCKHIVATILAYHQLAGKLVVRPSLQDLLDRLAPEELPWLLQSLIASAENPEALTQRLEFLVSEATEELVGTGLEITVKRTAVQQEVEDEIQQIVAAIEDGYDETGSITDHLTDLLDQLPPLIEQEQFRAALELLAGLCDGLAAGWNDLDDYGCTDQELIDELDQFWGRALLGALRQGTLPGGGASLAEQYRRQYEQELLGWGDLLDHSFPLAQQVLDWGWEQPELVAVLAGEDAVLPRLRILDEAEQIGLIKVLYQIYFEDLQQQQRREAAIFLAGAAGLSPEYLLALIQANRIAEALAAAPQFLKTEEATVTVVQELLTREDRPAALAIAEGGFDLALMGRGIPTQPLIWPSRFVYFPKGEKLTALTLSLAQEFDRLDLAQTASQVRFYLQPSLTHFLDAVAIAGPNADSLIETFLGWLSSTTNLSWSGVTAAVDIFLHLDRREEAIAFVSQSHILNSYSFEVQRVMDAVQTSHAEWVLAHAQPRAESIIGVAKSKYYADAVVWLGYVRASFEGLDRPQDWKDYRDALVSQHRRKRSLMDLMQQAKLLD